MRSSNLMRLMRSSASSRAANSSEARLKSSKLDASERSLSQLTSATGGRLYKPPSFATLDRVYTEIAEELRSQYALYYTPTDSARDGRFRRVRVEVPGRDLQVNTRLGFFAPR